MNFPLMRGFLEQDLRVKRVHLDLLVKSRMVTADDEQIGLPHSSFANLIIEAASAPFLNDIIRTIERRLPKPFPDGVLRSYVNGRSEYACRLLFKINRGSKDADRAIRSISENNLDVIRESIRLEENVYRIAWAIRTIRLASEPTAKAILENNSEILAVLGNKLRRTELGWESAELIIAVADVSESSAATLIPILEVQIAGVKAGWTLGDYVHKIVSNHEEIGTALVPALLEKLRNTELGYELGTVISGLDPPIFAVAAGKKIALKAIPILAEKILHASAWGQIVLCVQGTFGVLGSELGYELVPAIAQRLNADTTPLLIAARVFTIVDVDEALARTIFRTVAPQAQAELQGIRANPPEFAQKLNAATGSTLIAACVLTIADVDEALAKTIFRTLAQQAHGVLQRMRANPPNEQMRVQLERLFS